MTAQNCADVAKALGYKDTRHAITAHCKGGTKYPLLTNGGYQETNFISEGDVYRLTAQYQHIVGM